MANLKLDKRLVCGQCGDDQWKPYKKPRGYLNPKCNQCQKRKDCYICSSCSNSFCEKCSEKNKEKIYVLSQNIKQITMNNMKEVIQNILQYPNMHRNDNFEDMIKSLLCYDTAQAISFYQQTLDQQNNTNQKTFYNKYLATNVFDFITTLELQPLILKECLNYLDRPDKVFDNKTIHSLMDQYFLKNTKQDDEKEGIKGESDRILQCIMVCVTHNPAVMNQYGNEFCFKPLIYLFLNYFKYEAEVKAFTDALDNVLNVKSLIDMFEFVIIYYSIHTQTTQKTKLLIVQCIPVIFRLYPELLLSKKNGQDLLSYAVSIGSNYGDAGNQETTNALLELLSDKQSLQECAEPMFDRYPEFRDRKSIDWIMMKEEKMPAYNPEAKEGDITQNVMDEAGYKIADIERPLLSMNEPVQEAVDNKKYCYNMWYLMKWLLLYLLICSVQIVTSVLQFMVLYVADKCSLNGDSYEIECISLFCLTLLPFMFVLLFKRSEERTVEYVIFLVVLIMFWCIIFGLSVNGYIMWRDNIFCADNSWQRVIKILFMVCFIEQAFVSFAVLCFIIYQTMKKYVIRLAICVGVSCIQMTACIMQLIFIFGDKCSMNDGTAYKIESIFLFILYITAILVAISQLGDKIKAAFCGTIWFVLFGLSIHLYTVWKHNISCANNGFRLTMISFFIMWFSEQIIAMVGTVIFFLRDTIANDPVIIAIGAEIFCIFCSLIAIPITASLLQIIYIANGSCTGIDSATAISLFIVTILLITTSICLFFIVNGNIDHLFSSFASITCLICVGILWFTQFGLANASFTDLTYDDISCSSDAQKHALYGLFLTWVIIYSTIFIVSVISTVAVTCIEFGPLQVSTALIVLCQLGIFVVAPILQMILITSDDCEGDLVSVSETIFLIIFLILTCCLSIVALAKEETKKIVVCCEIILFIVIYIFVINSMNCWGSGQVHCGDKQPMKNAAFVLFLLWMIQYTLYIIAAVFGVLFEYCKP